MEIINKLQLATNLSANEDEVRKYALEHLKEIQNLTITELARINYTSPATITRLCKKLGVESFSQLKIQLASELSRRSSVDYGVEQIGDIRKGCDTGAAIVDRVTQATLNAIQETTRLVDLEVYHKVVNEIDKAAAIDFYGKGTSSLLVAADAAFKFMRIGKTVSYFDPIDRQHVQSLITPTDHIGILISYAGESQEILKIASILKKRHIKTVAITSDNGNSLTKLVNYVLPVSSSEPVMRIISMSSRISQLHVVDILFNLCFDRHYEDYLAITEDTCFL